MTFPFSDTTANSSMGFGNTAKPTFGTNTFAFGSGAATTSASGFGGGFGSAPATSNSTFGFGTTPASTTGNTGFGAFGTAPISTSSMFSGFGAPAATSTAFSGFGTNTGTTGSAFGTAAAAPFGTAGSAFGTANTAFGAAPPPFGSTAPAFGSTVPAFGSTAPTFGQTAPSFGSAFGMAGATGFSTQGFGSGFGNKPLGTTGTGFGGFGTNPGGAFGQQQQPLQQPQAAANPNEALVNAVFNCNVFGDERDQILAKWNFLQAKWGFGKAYFANNQPPLELTEQNPLCRFKAIGYIKVPTTDDKEGLVKLVFNKLEQEVKTQQAQLQSSLTALLGNKPNLVITIDSIKAISETKTEVIIFVMEKSATGGSGSKVAGPLLVQVLNAAMQRQMNNLGATNVTTHSKPDLKQKQEYLETPPPGIDVRLWKQAQADNPDPEKYIPMPIIGFSEVKWRMRCHEEQTRLHVAFLTRAAEELAELKGRHASTDAALHDQRRRYMHLHHRLLAVVVRQESARRAGAAMTPEEEALRGRLEALHAQLSAPTQFNGRLSELLSQMRMQRCQTALQSSERYSMDQGSQDDIRQLLTMQQKGMTHLIEIVHRDMAHLKLIQEGMTRIVHGAE